MFDQLIKRLIKLLPKNIVKKISPGLTVSDGTNNVLKGASTNTCELLKVKLQRARDAATAEAKKPIDISKKTSGFSYRAFIDELKILAKQQRLKNMRSFIANEVLEKAMGVLSRSLGISKVPAREKVRWKKEKRNYLNAQQKKPLYKKSLYTRIRLQVAEHFNKKLGVCIELSDTKIFVRHINGLCYLTLVIKPFYPFWIWTKYSFESKALQSSCFQTLVNKIQQEILKVESTFLAEINTHESDYYGLEPLKILLKSPNCFLQTQYTPPEWKIPKNHTINSSVKALLIDKFVEKNDLNRRQKYIMKKRQRIKSSYFISSDGLIRVTDFCAPFPANAALRQWLDLLSIELSSTAMRCLETHNDFFVDWLVAIKPPEPPPRKRRFRFLVQLFVKLLGSLDGKRHQKALQEAH